MNYNYLDFTAYHPSNPEKKVTVKAFSPRAAAMKARNILCSLGLMTRAEKRDRVKVQAIRGNRE